MRTRPIADRESRERSNADPQANPQFVSVRTLARLWDCSRTTVSRLLERAGVRAYHFGRGRNGSKRYRQDDIERYLENLDSV